MNKQLELIRISVAYDGNCVVNGVNFSLDKGSIGCLLGPSGCGKTTVLRAIAGFEHLQQGKIELNGSTVSSEQHMTVPEQRRVGMVFQDFALFPHLTVANNVSFGLRNYANSHKQQRIRELLDLVGLADSAEQHPHQLSGGQQQRVALARAMAPRPDVLLLDEPFSSLDPDLRAQLATEVRTLLKQDGVTAILVTHDQTEAFAMADEIGVMHQGKLHQWGKGYNLYHKPATTFVADFIGRGILLPAEIISQNKIQTPIGQLSGSLPKGSEPGTQLQILIRPDDLHLTSNANDIKATVQDRLFQGANYIYTLKLLNTVEIQCLAPSHQQHDIGSQVTVKLDVQDLVLFSREGLAYRSELVTFPL